MKKITFLLLLGLTAAANAQNTITPKEMADLFLKGETIQPNTKLEGNKTEEKKSEAVKAPITPKIEAKKVEVVKAPIVVPKVEEKKVEVVKAPIVVPVAPKVEEKRVEVVKAPIIVPVAPKVEEKKVEVVKAPIVVPKVELSNPVLAKMDDKPIVQKPRKIVKKQTVKSKPPIVIANNVVVPETGVIVKAENFNIPRSNIEHSMDFWKKPLTKEKIQVSLELIQPNPDDKRSYFEVNIKDLRTGLPLEDFYLKNVNGTSSKINLTQVRSNLSLIKNYELNLSDKKTINAEHISCSSFIVSYQLNEQDVPINVPFLLDSARMSIDNFGKDCTKPDITKERTIITKSKLIVNYNVSPRELANNMLSINMYISKDGQYIMPRQLVGYAVGEDFKSVTIMKPTNAHGYLVHGMDFKKKKDPKDYYIVFDFQDGPYNNTTYSVID